MTTQEKHEADTVPTAAEIQAVIAIVTAAMNAKMPERGNIFERRIFGFYNSIGLRLANSILFIIVTSILIATFSKSKILMDISLVLFLIGSVIWVAVFVPLGIAGIFSILRMSGSSYGWFLELVEAAAQMDLPYANELAKCPRHVVQYVLTYYKNERNSFEKRAGVLGGTIDKVGIFPALASLVLLLWNLDKVPGTNGLIGYFGIVLFFFYFMAIWSAAVMPKADRVIALLEHSVQSRK